jgi:hypothetical protein
MSEQRAAVLDRAGISDHELTILRDLLDAKYGGLRWFPDGHDGFYEITGGTRCDRGEVEHLEMLELIREQGMAHVITWRGIALLRKVAALAEGEGG